MGYLGDRFERGFSRLLGEESLWTLLFGNPKLVQ